MTGAPPELLDTWITGGLATGGLLTAHAIPQAQPPTTSYTYQWYSNAVLIVGATSQTYLVVAADSGLPITCAITPVNPQGAGPTTVTPVGVTVTLPELWLRTPPAGAVGSPIGLITNDGTVAGAFTAAGTARPVVAQINGVNASDFDGVDDVLGSTMVMSDIMDGTHEHGFMVVLIDAIDTDDPLYYPDDALICDLGGNWGLALRSTGPSIIRWRYRGASGGVSAAVALGVPTLIEWSCDGVTTSVRVGAGAAVSGALNHTTIFTGALRLGMNYSGGKHFDGIIAEPLVKKAIFGAGDVTALRTYYSGRYGVAV